LKILIDNNTRYRTDDIRRLVVECLKRDGIALRRLRLWVIYRGNRHRSGEAWLNSGNVRMFVLNPESELNYLRCDRSRYKSYYSEGQMKDVEERIERAKANPRLTGSVSFAEVFMHELQHCRGLKHEDMLSDSEAFDCSWAKQFPLRLKNVTQKPKEDLQIKRYNNVLKHIDEKRRVIKRNQNLLEKWEEKRNYYEKALKKNGKIE